jgi:outer membrane receptor for ferrienterochelin and colicin
MRPWMGALLLGTLPALPASADRAEATFRVAVTVPTRVELAIVDAPATILITAADLQRGYVDVPARYRVSHNARRGYLLQLSPKPSIASSIEVRGMGGTVILRDEPVELHMPGDDFEQDIALDLRLVFTEALSPGRVEAPWRLAVAAL